MTLLETLVSPQMAELYLSLGLLSAGCFAVVWIVTGKMT